MAKALTQRGYFNSFKLLIMSGQINNNLTLAKDNVLSLLKTKGVEGLKAKTVIVFDFSISMSNLYERGFVQQIFERLVPIAMAMDDDQSAEVYIFHNNCYRVLPDLTPNNLHNYIRDNITSKYRMGGTSYAPFIEMITQNFLDDKSNVTITKEEKELSPAGGFLSWFKSKPQKTEEVVRSFAKLPVFAIVFTDGDNGDKAQAIEAITKASYHAAFFQFVGLGNSDFPFLEQLDDLPGRKYDNANFFAAPTDDLAKHSDSEFYGKLFTEFPSWIKLVTDGGILKPQK